LEQQKRQVGEPVGGRLVGAGGTLNGQTHRLSAREFQRTALLFGLIFTSTAAFVPPPCLASSREWEMGKKRRLFQAAR